MKKNIWLLLIFILIIASFFRFWQLNLIPSGLYPDEAINGNDAINSLKTGNFRVFYPENNGREGLFIWLISLSFSIFGISIWAFKIVPAVIGIFTILGLYLLTKEIFNKNIALLSSFFLAISFWHTNFSRIGFRGILLPFVLVFSFYFLIKTIKSKKIIFSTLAGLFFGLGFYTYTPFRMAVLILPFIFIPWWLLYRKQNLQKSFLILAGVFLIVVFFVGLPIGIYFLENSQYFVSRAAPISVFAAKNPLRAFEKSLVLHLGMFNFRGDFNWRHNISGSPILFWPVGILFLMGFFYSFWKLFKTKGFTFLFLISSFFIMLLPSILTIEGIPHALRSIGAIPFVYIFAGLGTDIIYEKIKHSQILKYIGILLLVLIAIFQFYRYFFVWGENPEVRNAFSENYVEMGNYLNSLPPQTSKYVIVNASGVPVPYPNGIPMPAQTIMFMENTKFRKAKSVYLLPKDLEKIEVKRKTIVLPMADDKNLFQELKEKFPEGRILKIDNFSVYEIKP